MQARQPSEHQIIRQQLRQRLRQQRRALSAEQQAAASQAVCQQIQALPAFKQAGNIGLYLAFDGEIDLGPLFSQLWQSQRPSFVPLVDPEKTGIMQFHRFDQSSPTELNRFGISEPVFDAAACLAHQQLELVIAPLVGFDRQGNRLGMGGGYYDRLLSQVDKLNVEIIGVAHDQQFVEQLPTEDWDQALSRVITPSQDWRF